MRLTYQLLFFVIFLAQSKSIMYISLACLISLFPFFSDGVIAGATAGVVVETVLYPIDTIKTRLQAG